jgi:competence protein ComFC
MGVSRWGGWLLDFLYPRDCLECGRAIESDFHWRYLCRGCVETRLWRARPPCCPVCGHPFYGNLEQGRVCEHCANLQPCFGEGRTLILLRGAGRSWIHQIKYSRGRHLLADIRNLLEERTDLHPYLSGRILVPVPLHSRKQRERGFNQAYWIAREIVRFGKGSRIDCILRRRLDQTSQTRLDRKERAKNLKNTFALRKNHLVSKDNSYLIVDDVFTTGATLNACSRVLIEAGATQVDVFTMGHG